MILEDIKGKVLSNFIWRFLERSGAQIVQLVVSIVLARLLAPTDYGTIALMNVFISVLGSCDKNFIALNSLAPIYEVVIILSFFVFVCSISSSFINLSPLHLMNYTNISILSLLAISLFNSFIRSGSLFEFVNK